MNILGSFFLNEERKVFKGRAEVETDVKMKIFGNLVLAILYLVPVVASVDDDFLFSN